MKLKIILMLVALSAVLVSCGSREENGTLEGKVSIGPITPVESSVPPPTPPLVYAARLVMIYDQFHSKLIETLRLDDNGFYRVELSPGTYVVDINYAGADRSSDVPETIEIKPGIALKLNIYIDTGLR